MADKPTVQSFTSNATFQASKANTLADQLATAIEGCLGRGGTGESPNSMTGNIDMDLHKIINLDDPNADADAANKGYVDSLLSGTTDTGSAQLRADLASSETDKGADLVHFTNKIIDPDTINTSTINTSTLTATEGTVTTLSSTTATIGTIDCNGGAIDGTNVGASSPGTGAFTTLTQNASPVVTNILLPGFFQRTKFTYKDADEVYLHPAIYQHEGTTTQLLYWDSQLTFQFGSAGSNSASTDLGANQWHYLYLDDSAIVTAGTNLIAAAQLLNSTTAPTYSVSKHSWYNGLDRCIGAFRTNASNQILEFFNEDDLILFADVITIINGVDIDTTWTDAVLTIPSFCTKAIITFNARYTGTSATPSNLFWRTNGQSGTTGHYAGISYRDGASSAQVLTSNTITVITDNSQTIEVKYDESSNNIVYLYLDGWHFPIGM